mgnify:CR=1 FL=1
MRVHDCGHSANFQSSKNVENQLHGTFTYHDNEHYLEKKSILQ